MKPAVSCGAQFSRITLIMLNLIFLLCGIAFLIIGCIFRFGGDNLKKDVKTAFDNVQISNQNAYDLFYALAIIFIIAGCVIIVISLFGFIGASCKATWALYIYAVIVGLLVVLEVAGVVLFFIINDKVEEAFKDGLVKTIERANNPNSTLYEDSKRSVEYMMRTYRCCHVNGKRLNPGPNSTATTACSFSEIYSKDCYEAIEDWVKQYSTALIVIGICVIVVQILMIIFACVVARSYNKEEKLV